MPGLRLRKPGLWPTLAAVVGIALALALGNWQLGRGRDKTALAQRIESTNQQGVIALSNSEVKVDDVMWRSVEVRGRFEPKYTIFIDNRVLNGVVGYHVVTPLKIAESERYVLVNRGWVEGTKTRDTVPPITTPVDVIRIVGLATAPSSRYLELSTQVAQGKIWQNLTLERYRAAFPIAIQPVVIQQENNLNDGLKRDWDAPDLGVEKHYGYAFQWFALAAAILIFYLVVHVRKRARQAD